MIFVTGASGVIGRALIARLDTENLPYLILDRNSFANPIPLFRAVSCKPSIVVHLAAAVPQQPLIPDNEFSANLTRDMDVRILEAVKQWGCHVVYASGCALYDKSIPVPKYEEDVRSESAPLSPYLAAKWRGERDFLSLGRATVLRISAPIGQGLPSATVMGRFLEAAKAGGDLEIWGSGRREQNYVDVMDLADALFRTLVIRPSELINISANEPITMLELAQQVVQVCGRGFIRMIEKLDPRDGETALYSNRKAKELLGWCPKIPIRSSLERVSGIDI